MHVLTTYVHGALQPNPSRTVTSVGFYFIVTFIMAQHAHHAPPDRRAIDPMAVFGRLHCKHCYIHYRLAGARDEAQWNKNHVDCTLKRDILGACNKCAYCREVPEPMRASAAQDCCMTLASFRTVFMPSAMLKATDKDVGKRCLLAFKRISRNNDRSMNLTNVHERRVRAAEAMFDRMTPSDRHVALIWLLLARFDRLVARIAEFPGAMCEHSSPKRSWLRRILTDDPTAYRDSIAMMTPTRCCCASAERALEEFCREWPVRSDRAHMFRQHVVDVPGITFGIRTLPDCTLLGHMLISPAHIQCQRLHSMYSIIAAATRTTSEWLNFPSEQSHDAMLAIESVARDACGSIDPAKVLAHIASQLHFSWSRMVHNKRVLSATQYCEVPAGYFHKHTPLAVADVVATALHAHLARMPDADVAFASAFDVLLRHRSVVSVLAPLFLQVGLECWNEHVVCVAARLTRSTDLSLPGDWPAQAIVRFLAEYEWEPETTARGIRILAHTLYAVQRIEYAGAPLDEYAAGVNTDERDWRDRRLGPHVDEDAAMRCASQLMLPRKRVSDAPWSLMCLVNKRPDVCRDDVPQETVKRLRYLRRAVFLRNVARTLDSWRYGCTL